MIKQQKYDAVKEMLNSSMTHKQIAEAVEMKEKTIQIIEKSKDKAECDAMLMEYTRRSQQKKTKPDRQGAKEVICENRVILVANAYLAEELQKQTDLLTTISEKLAAIIDDLYGSEEEKTTKAK